MFISSKSSRFFRNRHYHICLLSCLLLFLVLAGNETMAAQSRPGSYTLDRLKKKAGEKTSEKAGGPALAQTPRPAPEPDSNTAGSTPATRLPVRKKIDLRRIPSAVDRDQYYVTFNSRPLSLTSVSPGHSFVGFRKILGDKNIQDEAFGFYPVSNLRAAFSTVPGKMVDDVRNGSLRQTTHLLQVRVDAYQYQSALQVLEKWRKSARSADREYSILKSNCVAFAGEVARVIGLNVPRTDAQFPEKFTLDLILANPKNAEDYTDIPGIAPEIRALNTTIHPDLREALRQANQEHLILLVDFYGAWCPWCLRMDESFADSSVKSLIAQNFYYAKVTVDSQFKNHRDCLTKYGVNGIPHLIAFNPDGTVRASQSGYLKAASLLSFLRQAAGAK